MNLKPAHPHTKSHHPNSAANATASRSQMAKRRSNRMALHATVGLSGEDRQKSSFTMPAKATKLNKHGAAVQLGRELLVGSVVSVNNKQGIQLSARVVAQLVALDGVSTYAIEFVDQDERAETFWGIVFPPNTSNA
jgi:PilZ domain-containing protein